MKRETIKKEDPNNKIEFAKTSTSITPDDGFVDERKLGYISDFRKTKYIKGYAKSVSFETDDPRVTKPILYIVISIFMVIGLIFLFTDIWFIGLIFLVVTFVVYLNVIRSIKEKEKKYLNKTKDITIDSIDETKEILSSINKEIKDGLDESIDYIKRHKK